MNQEVIAIFKHAYSGYQVFNFINLLIPNTFTPHRAFNSLIQPIQRILLDAENIRNVNSSGDPPDSMPAIVHSKIR